VHGETEKIVVTLRVMRAFSVLPGAPRACMFFRDPTDVSRLNMEGIVRACGWMIMGLSSTGKNLRSLGNTALVWNSA